MTVEHNNVTNRPLPVVAILACNRLNPTRALLKIRSMIKKQKTPHSGPGKSLKVTGYSSVLPNIY